MKERKVKYLLAVAIIVALLCASCSCLVACNAGEEDLEVVMIHIQDDAFPTVYVAGETIDVTNAKLELRLIDGSVKVIPITLDMISGFDTSTTGEKTFKVIYKGISATRSYRVVAATLIETPVKFALSQSFEEEGEFLAVSIQNTAGEEEGVFAFSFQIALVGASCGTVLEDLPQGFAAIKSVDGGNLKMTVYSEDGYTKYPADGIVCKVQIKSKTGKANATIQNIVVSNGIKDMSSSKSSIELPNEEK